MPLRNASKTAGPTNYKSSAHPLLKVKFFFLSRFPLSNTLFFLTSLYFLSSIQLLYSLTLFQHPNSLFHPQLLHPLSPDQHTSSKQQEWSLECRRRATRMRSCNKNKERGENVEHRKNKKHEENEQSNESRAVQSSEEHIDNGKAANTEMKLKRCSRRENQSAEEGAHRTWRRHRPAPDELLKIQRENNRIFPARANPCTNCEPSGNQVEIHMRTNSHTNQANFITNY